MAFVEFLTYLRCTVQPRLFPMTVLLCDVLKVDSATDWIGIALFDLCLVLLLILVLCCPDILLSETGAVEQGLTLELFVK